MFTNNEVYTMGVKERREREKSETRDKIIDAARDLFAVEGYDGVSMRQVAERIEYSPAAIYVHFADKEELFRELCVQDFRALADFFRAAGEEPDPIQRLRTAGQKYIEFALSHPNHYRLMFMTPHPENLTACDADIAKGNPDMDSYAFLLNCVREALAAGVFRPDLTDPELIAQTLWAAAHGLVSLQIAKGNDQWVDWRPFQQRAETIMTAVMKGLLKE